MGEITGIAWCHHTHNQWWGCWKVAPECELCYAEATDARWGGETGGHWGKNAPRRFFSAKHENEPRKWNAAARAAGERRRVFCGSMMDWAEKRHDLVEPRRRLWDLIRECRDLDWLMLTKRPEDAADCLPRDWGDGWDHVWLGTSVGHPKSLWRAVELLRVPAKTRFLSMEPLLDAIDLTSVPLPPEYSSKPGDWSINVLTRQDDEHYHNAHQAIDWVIVGGESGPRARPCHVEWIRQIVAQCKAFDVPVFVKQLGDRPAMDLSTWRDMAACGPAPIISAKGRDLEDHGLVQLALRGKKGGDLAEWPADLRIQEFPR